MLTHERYHFRPYAIMWELLGDATYYIYQESRQMHGLINAFVQHQSFPRQGSYWFSVFVNNTDIASIEQSTDPTIDIYLYG